MAKSSERTARLKTTILSVLLSKTGNYCQNPPMSEIEMLQHL
jgi:hypothetical protein